MKLKAIVVCALGSLLLALAPAAFADTATIGSVAPPSGSTSLACSGNELYAQLASASATPFAVPARGKAITAWQTNISEIDQAGTQLKLLVLRWQPEASPDYEVVATDTETLPESTLGNEIASFTLGQPIAVLSGDILGLQTEGEAACGYEGGGISAADKLGLGGYGGSFTAGEQVGFYGLFSGAVLDVSATVALQSLDLGVAATATPASAVVGQLATLSSTISNVGEAAATDITFVDEVQSGLSVSDAVVGGGACSINAQKVTCTVPQLAPGANVPVVVMVSPRAAGSYLNKVSVSSDPADSDPANNAAQATLTALEATPSQVIQPPVSSSPVCHVPALKAVRLSVAKKLLSALHCKLGKVSKRHSARIAKGSVIFTQPHAGAHPAQTAVALTVSSGPAKHKHSHVKHKHGMKHKGKAAHAHKHGVKHKGKAAGAHKHGA